MRAVFGLWWVLVVLAAAPLHAADRTEAELINVLQSASSPAEKQTACAELKLVATKQSIPAVAALLVDPGLSHSARYVLESMPAPEAGQALIDALGKTSGLTRAGLLNSLGFRREARAVPALIPLLGDTELEVHVAAARALGQIGSNEALSGLESALAKSSGPAHEAEVDGVLRCAQRWLADGQRAKAFAVFQRLYQREADDSAREASYRGMILSAKDHGRALILQALVEPRGASQTAAVQALHEVEDSGLGEAVLQLLPKLPLSLVVALLDGLSQRADVRAGTVIPDLARTGLPEVRVAALKALGALGDARVVPFLAEAAATTAGAEQAAARQALVDLRSDKVAQALVANLTTAKPEVQAELARALGARSETSAIPHLMTLAKQGNEAVRRTALRALAFLADQPQLGDLVGLVIAAPDSNVRAEAVDALNNALQNIQARHGRVDTALLVAAVAPGSPTQARVALLGVCSSLAEPSVRAALRGGINDTNSAVRLAAIQALADTTDPELLPDLMKLACAERDTALRTRVVGGCVRLLTQEEAVKLSNERKLDAFKALLAADLNVEQKRKVLAGVGEVADPQALALVEPLLDEASVQAEAASAVIKLVPALADTPRAESLLKKILALGGDAATRQAAEAALKPILARGDYILAWQAAGPYRQADKDFNALFDIPFPPETAGAPDVAWGPLIPGTDPKRPIVLDLLKAFGGEQCVAYARTFIYSDQAQPARLEVGADDGVKVWFNGELVCAKNVPRAIQPGSEKADVTLKAGWNSLLLKVTQLNQGWEFCARVVKPDGSRLTGLRFDPAHRP